jgi:hypothetical protein
LDVGAALASETMPVARQNVVRIFFMVSSWYAVGNSAAGRVRAAPHFVPRKTPEDALRVCDGRITFS